MRLFFTTIIALCLLTLSAAAQLFLHPLRETGPRTNRVNVVFLAEGFAAHETNHFFTTATNLMNGFLETGPFGRYKTHLNFYAIFVASNESGSDHPDTGIFKDTYFNSSYDSYGVPYTITIPPNERDPTYANGLGKVDEILELIPEHDIPILVVNDSEYGGSGGYVPMCSVAPASRDIAIHEVGHSFAGLGDEYEAPYPGYPIFEEPNTTQETDRDKIKWKAWIEDSTPIPTPSSFGTKVGLFEGARYQSTGWYRPQRDCKMRALTAPFCAICSEALVKAIYECIRPVDSFSPSIDETLTIVGDETLALSVATLPSLKTQWHLNGIALAGETNSTFVVSGSLLPPGTSIIKAVVRDITSLVRNDPDKLLTQSLSWSINAIAELPMISARLDGGIILSFPAGPYLLQFTESLNPGGTWQAVTAEPENVGGLNSVRLPLNAAQLFFRLAGIAP